jgi:hypothetical protein
MESVVPAGPATPRRPNLFILGAPKCGTTSLAHWLSGHPGIFMSPVKEPKFFNTDARTVGGFSKEEYERLFLGADETHRWLAEGSTAYLRSTTAVSNILAYAQDPRFVICVRNPVEMVVSLHGERIKQGVETETGFEQAWRLQESRQQGRLVPRLCVEPSDLLYGPICRVGHQLERVLAQAGADRVIVVVLDDIRADPAREYRRVLDFLGLPDDGRTRFSAENKALYLPPLLAGCLRFAALAKQLLRIRAGTGVTALARRALGRPPAKSPLSPELRNELRTYFRDDVSKLSAILGRDFSHWLDARDPRADDIAHLTIKHSSRAC